MEILVDYPYGATPITFKVDGKIHFEGRIKHRFLKGDWMFSDNSKNEVATYKRYEFNFAADFTIAISTQGKPSYSFNLNYRNDNPHFAFSHGSDDYLIALHPRNKFSFFKNDQQIAFMQKSGPRFIISCDDDANIELFMILFCGIAICHFNDPDGYGPVYLRDFANRELRPIDHGWQANVN